MIRTCIVSTCKQTFDKNSNNLFYSLPKDKEQLTRWLAAMNQKTFEIKPTHVICSKHFHENDFYVNTGGQKAILKPHAVPSIFENRTDIKSPKKIRPKKLRKQIIKPNENKLSNKYNLRRRVKEKPNTSISTSKLKKYSDRNLDHTYSTSKPEPSSGNVKNTNHTDKKVNISDHTYFTSAKLDNFSDLSDHTYTRQSAGRDPGGGGTESLSQRHVEHNYSLNSGKKRAKLDTSDKNPVNVNNIHGDHAYLSTNKKDDKPVVDEVDAEKETVPENIVLDLRDHTYSKNNKKLKKDKVTDKTVPIILNSVPEKKLDPPKIDVVPVGTNHVNIRTELQTRNSPNVTEIKNPKLPEITLKHETTQQQQQQPLVTECILLRQVARQYVATKEFNQLKHCLFILKPSDEEDRAPRLLLDNTFNVQPTYIVVDEKYFKPDEAVLSMEKASNLFKEVFNRSLSDVKIATTPVSYYDNDICCQQFNVTELLRSCAVRRRFAQPRYVGDYKITDMDCVKNARRYYELSQTRMESQKFLIQKLRTQNSRLGNRFRKLSQEILKIRKDKKISTSITNHVNGEERVTAIINDQHNDADY